jgi:hypothetical protein
MEFDKIGEFVKEGSKDYDMLFRLAHSQVGATKGLGLMRLGMILDTMQKAVSRDRVESNMQELERYRGLYPVLKMEQVNAQFVYDAMVGNRIKKFELLEFKDDIKPDLREIMAAAMNKMAGGIRPSIPGGRAPATPSLAPQTPATAKAPPPKKKDDDDDLKKRAADEPAAKRAWDDEEEKKPAVVDEEAKKKARAEMRKKLMLPDSVNTKL